MNTNGENAFDKATRDALMRLRRHPVDCFGEPIRLMSRGRAERLFWAESHRTPTDDGDLPARPPRILEPKDVIDALSRGPMRGPQIAARLNTQRARVRETTNLLLSKGRVVIDAEAFFHARGGADD